MQSAACPRCAEPIRVPAGDAAATARCPWCCETFSLGEVLDSLPPMLEIIDSGGIGDYPGEAPLTLDEDSVDQPFSAAGHFDPGALDGGASIRSSPRRSRRTSPVVSFLKIAGGGIAGILIALAILQYLNRLPDLGFGPFRGPTSQRVADNSRTPYQRRPPQPRSEPTDATAAPVGTDQDLSGDPQVDLPLPDFGSEDASPLAQNIDEAEQALAEYRAASDEAADTSDHVERVAEALAAIGGTLADATDDAHEQHQQIDSLVSTMATDQRLLKQLLKMAAERLEAAAPEANTGVFAIGQLSREGSEYHLKKSTKDPKPLRMLVDEEDLVEVPKAGSIVIVLGIAAESSGEKAIRARYVGALARRR